MKLLPMLLAVGGLGLAASLAVGAQPETSSRQPAVRQCFLPSQINGFSAVDRDTVHVNVSASQVYELELFGDCPDVDWEQRIAIRSTGGSNWVCRGLDAELVVGEAPEVLGGVAELVDGASQRRADLGQVRDRDSRAGGL